MIMIMEKSVNDWQGKPASVPLCPPQTPHAARTRTQAAGVGSQRLTAELRHGLQLLYKNITNYTKHSEQPHTATKKNQHTNKQ
jgi:hypothetical protein